MNEKPKIKVFLVDDHPVVLKGVKGILADHPDIEVIGEATTGKEALEKVGRANPDIILLDFELPDMPGLNVSKWIHARYPHIKIIFLTAQRGAGLLSRLLSAPVSGLMTKEHSTQCLNKVIKAVAAGKTFVQPDIVLPVLQYREAVHSIERLGEQEFIILKLSATGMNSPSIAKQLSISPKTVRNQKSRAMDKAGIRNMSELREIFSSLEA